MKELLGLMSPENANRVHWEAARHGRISVQQCECCATLRFPAAALCANCASTNSRWVDIAPAGRILSWCRFHRAYFREFEDKLPYTVLLVELDGGIRLYANPAWDSGDEDPVIGAAVTAVFESVDDRFGLIKFAYVS